MDGVNSNLHGNRKQDRDKDDQGRIGFNEHADNDHEAVDQQQNQDGIVGDAENEIFRAGSLAPSELLKLSREHQKWIDSGHLEGADARVALTAKGLSGPDRDIIVLATPEMAELSNWIIAFVAAGGLAAAAALGKG